MSEHRLDPCNDVPDSPAHEGHPELIELDRRRLLTGLSATALTLAASSVPKISWASDATSHAAGNARLATLELRTAADLAELSAFYGEALGLAIDERRDRLEIEAGDSRILFRPAAEGSGRPFYHFAFNIPENKILAAREWQLERSELFRTPKRMRDPRYPDDVRHFRSWNAHSIFFWDPAGNVVEYIARHELDNAAPGGFGPQDLLCASEIAFIVDDVENTAAAMQGRFELESYTVGGDQFHALGDENGLLLIFARGRELGDPLAGRPKPAAPFPADVRIRGQRAGELAPDGTDYTLEGLLS